MADLKNNFLDEVLKKNNIVDIIQEVTPLEKQGSSYLGLCPFHDEKTPSFRVSEEKQVYHCFGCKASGNAITFLKDTKGYTTQEALKDLAQRAGIEYKQTKERNIKDKYYQINQEALNFYRVILNHTKEGQEALDYLTRRGFDQTSIDTFDLGLSSHKKDALYQALKKKDYLDSDLLDLALIRDDHTIYDFFRDRIMFPLHTESGEVVGFSGRIYKEGEQTAKYINSPQTPVFEKHKVLYNLHRAKKAIKDKNRVVILEGFMDVIAATRAGVSESVAVMGTALTDYHIRTLKRYTDEVILCFDGDQAGQDATIKFIEDLKQAALNVNVVTFNDKMDPDEFIKKEGSKAFLSKVDNALTQEEFLYNYYKMQVNFNKLTEMEKFKRRIFALIKRLSSTEQNFFLTKLSEDLSMKLDNLEQDFKQQYKYTQKPRYERVKKIDVTDKFIRAERGLIHYFLKDKYYTRRFLKEFNDIATYFDKDARDIQFEILELYDIYQQICIVPALFIKRLSATQRDYFETYIDYKNYPYQEDEFDDFLEVMHEYKIRLKIKTLKKKLQEAESITEKISYKMKIDQFNKEAKKHGKR